MFKCYLNGCRLFIDSGILERIVLLNPLIFKTSDLTFELILTKIKGLQLGGQTEYSFRQILNNCIA